MDAKTCTGEKAFLVIVSILIGGGIGFFFSRWTNLNLLFVILIGIAVAIFYPIIGSLVTSVCESLRDWAYKVIFQLGMIAKDYFMVHFGRFLGLYVLLFIFFWALYIESFSNFKGKPRIIKYWQIGNEHI